jgi:nucleotidyltransferase substrate binding protein (TIGR01987 family)
MQETDEKLAWKNSFLSLKDALERFTEVVDLSQSKKDDIIIDATIKRFEFTLELFWKTLKKILAYEKVESTSPRDVVRHCQIIT